ncbi:hypothetical protein GCM10019016_051060 [Streptomyces prasinosporus]|uniref:Uncharacterized protein n=1 Tax=Streptomyces prasinosporus TaxID=68256 RepID=A0ABP6TRR2_9ACTN
MRCLPRTRGIAGADGTSATVAPNTSAVTAPVAIGEDPLVPELTLVEAGARSARPGRSPRAAPGPDGPPSREVVRRGSRDQGEWAP